MTLPDSSANAPSRSSLPAPKDCQNPPIAVCRETAPGSAESLHVAESGQSSHRCAAIIVYRERCSSPSSVGSIYCDYHRKLVRHGHV